MSVFILLLFLKSIYIFVSIQSSNESMKKLPLVIFGVVTLVGGILCYFLPETHNCPLPVSIEDIENLTQNRKYKENQGAVSTTNNDTHL